jgi:hypothetical protein
LSFIVPNPTIVFMPTALLGFHMGVVSEMELDTVQR